MTAESIYHDCAYMYIVGLFLFETSSKVLYCIGEALSKDKPTVNAFRSENKFEHPHG